MATKRLRYDPSHDLYVVLGVAPSATPDELQRAFRQRAKEVHPDLHPENKQANQQFQALNDAYNTLSNPPLRAEYDRLRQARLGFAERYFNRDAGWFVDDQHPPDPDGVDPERDQPDFSQWRSTAYRGNAGWEAGWTARGAQDTPDSPGSPAAGGVFRAAWRRMMRSYSHRLVLSVLAFVLFANIAAVLVLPQVTALIDSAVSAQTTRTAQAHAAQTRRSQPRFVLLNRTPTPMPDAPAPTCANPQVRISAPTNGAEINMERFDIRGSAAPPGFAAFTIEIDSLSSGARWILSLPIDRPVTNGVLVEAVSIGNMPMGDYLLRLRVQIQDGSFLPPCEVRIRRKR
jgi:curved DNA-binding protein CbpA